MDKANRIRAFHLEKTLKKLPPLTEEERNDLDRMTEAIVVRLLKDPISYRKENAGGNGECAGVVSRLFHLENEEPR
jgi:glutamyl-tRNA reductase